MDDQVFLTVLDYTGTRSGGDSVPPVIGSAPTSLTATADSDSIALAWTNNDTYTSTVIERKTTDQYTALAVAAGNATSYDDTTAVIGTTYTYKVRGVKNGYPTPYSNEASDTIPVSTVHSASFDGGGSTDLVSASLSTLNRTDQTTVIIGCWVKFTSDITITSSFLAGKIRSADEVPDFTLTMNDKKFRYHTFNAGGTSAVDSVADAVQSTLYYVVGYTDPNTTTIGISINGAAFVTFDYSGDAGTVDAQDGVFEIGGNQFDGNTLNGLIDEVYACKDPADLAAALTFARTTIYNGGSGKLYSTLSGANKTTLGLISWWGLDETSGNRLDLNGNGVTLVPTGITAGTPLVS